MAIRRQPDLTIYSSCMAGEESIICSTRVRSNKDNYWFLFPETTINNGGAEVKIRARKIRAIEDLETTTFPFTVLHIYLYRR